MDNKIRTSRESDTRKTETRKSVWTPPSSLDAPPAPQGFAHRWVRTAVAGFEDTANVTKNLEKVGNLLEQKKLKILLRSTNIQLSNRDNMKVASGLEALCWQGYLKRY
jgi:hypothetical protein